MDVIAEVVKHLNYIAGRWEDLTLVYKEDAPNLAALIKTDAENIRLLVKLLEGDKSGDKEVEPPIPVRWDRIH